MKKLISFTLFLFVTVTFGQNWTAIADLPVGLHHPVGWGLNGKGYVATGSNSSDIPTDVFYEYDPATDSWTTLTDFPGPARSFAIGTTYDGKGYMGFGASLSQYFDDLWSYDPNTDQWTQLATCPCSGRRHPSMIASNDKIYVGLGDDATGNLRDWWVYDITTNNWSQLPSLPGPPRHHPFQFTVNGQIYAGMGHGPSIYDDWYKLDTASNSWTLMNYFPGEARVAGTQFNHGNHGYVLSGDGDNHNFMATGEFWEYDASNDSWVQLTAHPGISRWAPGSFVINDDVYFFGGRNRQTTQNPTTAYKYPLSSGGVGLAEAGLNSFDLYPNPASNVLHWKSDKEIDEVRVVNTVGQEILQREVNSQSINVPGLKSGMYLVKFFKGGNVLHTERVMIQP